MGGCTEGRDRGVGKCGATVLLENILQLRALLP